MGVFEQIKQASRISLLPEIKTLLVEIGPWKGRSTP
jgi:hypothetical protein